MSKAGCGVRPTGMMRRLRLPVLIAVAWAVACSDNPGEPKLLPPLESAERGLIVSDPALAITASPPGDATASAPTDGDDFTYASLLPGTVPAGAVASVRAVRSGSLVWTTLTDGGFDPVALVAALGDTVVVEVQDASHSVLYTARMAVAAGRRPIVVRTEPPPRKRDVPLNAPIVIVFSEPVDAATLTESSVRLVGRLVPFPVPGTIRLLPGSGTAIAFIPRGPLARNRDFRLVVTGAVTDLDGDALVDGVTVEFTTGQVSVGPAASIELLPDTVNNMTGPTYQMTATVRDAAGAPLIDLPITWSTSDPSGLTVSPTGLLTALAAGYYQVTAGVDGLTAQAIVVVTAGPPASVAVSPSPANVAAGDTIVLTATVRDAMGRLVFYPQVTWATTDSGVAIAAAGGSGNSGLAYGIVSGMNLGVVTITATSGTASDTIAVTVIPPLPVASVTVTPDSATVLVQGTVQLSAMPSDADGRQLPARLITWTSSNSAAATVDSNGLVTAVAAGSTTVTATSEGVSGAASVTATVITLASVSAGGGGGDHTCGLTTSGAAYCWGSNLYGQLGDNTWSDRLIPVPVSGGLTFVAIVAKGAYHTCGIALGGAAYCWGNNDYGQLGNPSTAYSSTRPVLVSGGLNFVALTAGPFRTCGVTTNGAAYCWGSGLRTPARVGGALTFRVVAGGGGHTCGVTTTGAGYCWGENAEGQLGDSTRTDRPTPVPVSGGHNFTALAAGAWYTCGLATGGAAYCWGNNNYGNLGDGTVDSRTTPGAVSGGFSFASVSAGVIHTCGVTLGGAAYCWGYNVLGELGDGSTIDRSSPVAVSGGLTFSLVSAGGAQTCGISTSGIVYCWGANHYGQLGDGTLINSALPVKVAGQP